MQRIAEFVLLDDGDVLGHEFIKVLLAHVNTLDAAATLAGVVHRAVHQHVNGQVQVRILTDIPWVLAAKLQPVEGGRAVHRAAAERFVAVGLELGGKDPAYVRADADLPYAIENVVDGAFFNSGQSCCGIERVYVHESVYDQFVEGAAALVRQYKLGSPMDPETTLSPVVRGSNADRIRAHIKQAIELGARPLIDASDFPAAKNSGPYLAPQVLVDVDHDMEVMWEETFGPVVGIMKVDGDDRAVELMNDSPYGLTASIWTQDYDTAAALGAQVETGTVFMNRADYLDPALTWTGVKDTGRGTSLSYLGFHSVTRPKSYHMKKVNK